MFFLLLSAWCMRFSTISTVRTEEHVQSSLTDERGEEEGKRTSERKQKIRRRNQKYMKGKKGQNGKPEANQQAGTEELECFLHCRP